MVVTQQRLLRNEHNRFMCRCQNHKESLLEPQQNPCSSVIRSVHRITWYYWARNGAWSCTMASFFTLLTMWEWTRSRTMRQWKVGGCLIQQMICEKATESIGAWLLFHIAGGRKKQNTWRRRRAQCLRRPRGSQWTKTHWHHRYWRSSGASLWRPYRPWNLKNERCG